MRPRISIRGCVHPSVSPYVRPLALKQNRRKPPEITEKHGGCILIHLGRIYLPTRALGEEPRAHIGIPPQVFATKRFFAEIVSLVFIFSECIVLSQDFFS